MIRIERNPVFWEKVAAHPACAPALMGATPEAVGYMAGLPIVLPLAAEHGGFFFTRLDALGLVMELHTLFTRKAGVGEVLTAAKAACRGVRGRVSGDDDHGNGRQPALPAAPVLRVQGGGRVSRNGVGRGPRLDACQI